MSELHRVHESSICARVQSRSRGSKDSTGETPFPRCRRLRWIANQLMHARLRNRHLGRVDPKLRQRRSGAQPRHQPRGNNARFLAAQPINIGAAIPSGLRGKIAQCFRELRAAKRSHCDSMRAKNREHRIGAIRPVPRHLLDDGDRISGLVKPRLADARRALEILQYRSNRRPGPNARRSQGTGRAL